MAINTDPLLVDSVLLRQAELVCMRRVEKSPQDRAALHSLAEVYRKRGLLGEAAAIYERLSRLDPRDEEAGYLQAVLSGREVPAVSGGIRPAPFVYLKDFLPGEFHDSLLPFLVSVREKFVPALVASAGGGGYMPDYRDTLDFTDKWESKLRFGDCFREILPRLVARLHVTPFETAGIELHVRAYADGHFFKVHRDTAPARLRSRAISFVYFFHRLPRPYAGGDLLLFDTDPDANRMMAARFTRIVPEDNVLVAFPSTYYHCVVPVCCPSKDFADSRFVINGFVHARTDGNAPAAAEGSQPVLRQDKV